MKFATKAIHAGIEPDPATGAIMTPIYQTSTYVQEYPGVHKGYEYGRTQNPTRSALQNNLAALENGKHGLCFSSGLGATDAVIKMFKPGDEIIASNDLYGGSYRLFTTVFEHYGIKFHFVDMQDVNNIKAKLNANTRLVWFETPTNPMLSLIDIKEVAELVKDTEALVAVDNTFASPYLQNPLDLGADIVMHSVTKYLGGHSDVVMGALIVNDDVLAAELERLQNSCGAVPGPQDCFLVLRGIKTLHLRMKAHCENGSAIAELLKTIPSVDKVFWPGFHDHPNHDIARSQMNDFGGMMSFTLKEDTQDAAYKVLNNFKYFSVAESLGGVESLCGHPATMTHASVPVEQRNELGITDSLIRLSVGVEDIEDLKADVVQALS